MKICMAGLGSIGQRHLGNIRRVLSEREQHFTVDALRVKGRQLPGETASMVSKTYHSFEELPNDYDIIFVTNPTVFHYETVRLLAGKTRHMFVEKPVFEEHKDTAELGLSESGIYYVACPLRHKKVIRQIREWMKAGERFHSVRAVSSSYLPDWRKGTDYRDVYSSKRSMGGGVELDLIHEWDYISELFGMPEQMMKFAGKYSGLEIDSDDLAVYIARYADRLLEIHLDYFGTEPVRLLELIGDRKKYVVDIGLDQIRIMEYGKPEQIIDFGQDDFYLSEMKYFFDLIRSGKKSFNEIERANELLGFVLGE